MDDVIFDIFLDASEKNCFQRDNLAFACRFLCSNVDALRLLG
jgi:hypothetical protein